MNERDATLREAQRLEDEHRVSDPFAAAIRATRMPIVITDAKRDDNPIVFANDAFVTLSGYAREEIIGRNCRFLQGPSTDRDKVAKLSAGIASGESVAVELLNYRKDGSEFWNALQVSPVFDAGGSITHFFGSQFDVTERNRSAAALSEANTELGFAKASAEALVDERTRELQRALDQKTMLLHEVDHRVKNNLQLIASLILLQSRRIADPEIRRTVKSTLERVSALAIVHRSLFQTEDLASFDVPAFVRAIAHDLREASGRDDIDIAFELEPVSTPAANAAPVALILNELLTNALRHGFVGRGGRVRIVVRRLSQGFEIEVADDGVGRPDGPAREEGLGRTLIDLLARQLSAEVEERNANPGVSVRLTVPGPRASLGRG